MRKKSVLIIILFILIPLFIKAKESQIIKQKVIQAVHLNHVVTIDGRLDEPVWNRDGYSDFVQSDPHDGAQPTERTIVWVAYDDQALYVAARLLDSEPEHIISRLGRRDDFVDSDWFIFSVDPYFDHRTGFQFAVSPAGSICDWTLYNDEWKDDTWDGIWEWATSVDEQGWSVEIKIPYNQLRFPKKSEYIWGVNFQRIIKRKNEKDNYVWIPKEESGFVSRFARLEGINGIHPGRHIEFLPYTVGEAQFSPAEEGNPFETGKDFLGNFGLDLKIGVKSNLTLDATINPDFGQVEVDPAVINLSAYETYYKEKRPFFIEGANIFNAFGRGGSNSNTNINWSSPQFFYSRRIGGTPHGEVSSDGYVKYPSRTSILGAFKLSSKLGNGWNMGFINALTAREYAHIEEIGKRFREEVEPFSYYGVLRLQKEFNKGAQGFGFISTSVIRNLKQENLADILNDKAFSLAFDGWFFLDKDKTWVLTGWAGWTLVKGNPEAILNLQKSSLHYFQRPDADHVSLNEEANSLAGWAGRFQLNKQKGNWVFNMALGALSPGFDPTDVGFQFGQSDLINGHLLLGYRQPHPGKIWRNWWVVAAPFYSFDFGGHKTWEGYLILVDYQFLNYWRVNTMIAYNPKTLSNDLTRGGPLALVPSGRQINFNFFSDSRKPVVLSLNSNHYLRPTEGFGWSRGLTLRWKPRSNISLSIGPGYYSRRSKIQWITEVKDPLMAETYGHRYIFGRIWQRTLYAEIRINWTFTPKLSLQLYLQPFLAIGKYDQFKELARPRSFDYHLFGEEQSTISYQDDEYTVDPDGPGPAAAFSFDNPDFNLKSIRGTMVLRWEYAPGSLLYLVWTQNREDTSHPGDFNFRRDLGDLLAAPGDNIFLIKFSYRWNL